MAEDKIKVEEFLKYFEPDTYVELYDRDTSAIGLEYEGMLEDLMKNKELYHEYLEMLIRPEAVSIDPPGVLCILMDIE